MEKIVKALEPTEVLQGRPSSSPSRPGSSPFPLEANFKKDKFVGRGAYGEVYKYVKTSDPGGAVGGSPRQVLPPQVAVKKVTKAG